MNLTRIIFILLVSGFCHTAYSAGIETEAYVTNVGFYGEGRVFVSLDTVIEDLDCPGKARFDVSTNSPIADKVFSLAMAAMLSNKKVVVRTGTCIGTFPALGDSTSSWFFIKP